MTRDEIKNYKKEQETQWQNSIGNLSEENKVWYKCLKCHLEKNGSVTPRQVYETLKANDISHIEKYKILNEHLFKFKNNLKHTRLLCYTYSMYASCPKESSLSITDATSICFYGTISDKAQKKLYITAYLLNGNKKRPIVFYINFSRTNPFFFFFEENQFRHCFFNARNIPLVNDNKIIKVPEECLPIIKKRLLNFLESSNQKTKQLYDFCTR